MVDTRDYTYCGRPLYKMDNVHFDGDHTTRFVTEVEQVTCGFPGNDDVYRFEWTGPNLQPYVRLCIPCAVRSGILW